MNGEPGQAPPVFDPVMLEASLRVVRSEVSALLREVDRYLLALVRSGPRHQRGGAVVRPPATLPMIPTNAAELVADRRKALGMSQTGLARRAGYGRSAVAETERGARNHPHSVRDILATLDELEEEQARAREGKGRSA